MELTSGILTATMTASVTSTSLEVGGYSHIAVIVPDLTTSTYLTVQVSHDDSSWEELWDRYLATPVDVRLVESKSHVVEISGWKYVRFLAADAQTVSIYVRGM
jgi:hypothetical protein